MEGVTSLIVDVHARMSKGMMRSNSSSAGLFVYWAMRSDTDSIIAESLLPVRSGLQLRAQNPTPLGICTRFFT